ncbi:MAG TPA: glycosyltransferase [bacterium]|nr:glycosyltransferase [bacterium]HPN35302.1 glycosyltransferase [bacterium]
MNPAATGRLWYLSNERIPGPSAASIQQVHMCAAFARIHAKVTLVRPWYAGVGADRPADLAQFYGTLDNFNVVTTPTLLNLSRPASPGRWRIPLVGGASVWLTMSFWLYRRLRKIPAGEPLLLYSRSVNAAMIGLWLRQRFFRNRSIALAFEAHSLAQQPAVFFRSVLRRCDGVIAISHALKTDLSVRLGVAADKVLVAADGISEERLASPPRSIEEARKAVNMPCSAKKLVVYTGSSKPGKGAEMFVQAAALASADVLFLFVGDRGQAEVRRPAPANLYCTGRVAPSQAPLFQAAADVLVLPNVAEGSIHAYTSPLKLFEYMAANRPIVASELAVLREVLTNEDNCLLVPAGNPAALADAVERLLQDEALAARIAARAYAQVRQYTWEKRAQNILDFLMDKR